MMTRKKAPPYIVEDRRMLSRVSGDGVRITHTIQPGSREKGVLTCFHAPDNCPYLASFPCIDWPSYIVSTFNASHYIHVRENSLEWNTPRMQMARGDCCGCSPCQLAVRDDVTVLYFDDIHFNDVKDDTRNCNDGKTFWCGGRGEKIRIETDFAFGMLRRGRGGAISCVPTCCCTEVLCCPCTAVESEIWVENADSAVKIIKMARDDARSRMEIED
mmetsp:Transcript_12033/g.17103  ORF Transcript_12033/g.17103 Transcript_12033/m.17103 type:complete len:216 (-) Transcript_12033:706-1353(-)